MPKLPMFTAPQTKGEGDFLWFVYGSTLDFDALRHWCGEHGYRLPDVENAKPARLPGWRLAFNVRSNFWGGAVASLVEDPPSGVEGIAIPVGAGGLGFVRHKEGVLSGLFEEREGTCEIAGEKQPCRFYVANPARTVPEEKPAGRFLDTVLKGAKERGLSEAWQKTLESLR